MVHTLHVAIIRKPPETSCTASIATCETGALNIDGTRTEYQSEYDKASATPQGKCTSRTGNLAGQTQGIVTPLTSHERAPLIGRFPANIILTTAAAIPLDAQSGITISTGGSGEKSRGALGKRIYGKFANDKMQAHAGGLGDKGGASRYFKVIQ